MPGKPDPERQQTVEAWAVSFGTLPPPFLSVRFMKLALAHEAQCHAHGGLPAQTRRDLRRIAEGGEGALSDTAASTVRAGSHLVREWNGRTYRVEVLPDGYRLNGKTWTSLSAIARHITGTNWSGPRFFGLKRSRSG